MKDQRICIIPARGGSKRLPRKNIIDFDHKPIISYTILSAIESDLFKNVIVSTDDEEIADISSNYGADIDIRNKKLATDEARVVNVCLDFLNTQKSIGNHYDVLCCLYPTAPLRNVEDIINSINLLENENCNSVMAVTEFHYPCHQALKMDKDNYLNPMWPDLVSKRSSELPKLYVDNGSTYSVKVEQFIKEETFILNPFKGYIMPRNRSVDIDNNSDLDLAKYYMNKIKN